MTTPEPTTDTMAGAKDGRSVPVLSPDHNADLIQSVCAYMSGFGDDWLKNASQVLREAWQDLEEENERIVKKSRSWRSMKTAPKNFESVILKFRNDIYPKIRPGRPDLQSFNGIVAVMNHTGEHTEWGFSAPVGCGGFPDEWFSGWHPLPADQEQVEE